MKMLEEIDLQPADDRKTLEWITVLAAAGLDYRLSHPGGQWIVHIPLAEADPAWAELAAYEADDSTQERVRMDTSKPRVESDDSWSPVWVAGMLIVFYAWIGPYSHSHALASGAAMDTDRFLAGEWWRTVTALTVHSGVTHLVGNVVGLLLLGHAGCQTFGGGLGWLLILASGMVGNAAASWLHGSGHVSVGASTACFGALGILSACQSTRKLRQHGFSTSIWSRMWVPIGAGFALLTLLGTGEQSDLLAHLFGFVVGMLLCTPFIWRGPPKLSPGVQQVLELISLCVVMTAWRLVLVGAA